MKNKGHFFVGGGGAQNFEFQYIYFFFLVFKRMNNFVCFISKTCKAFEF